MQTLVLLVFSAVAAILVFVMICVLLDMVPRAEEKEPERPNPAAPTPPPVGSKRTLPTLARAVGSLVHLPRAGGQR
jgi:hypothetical protein